MLRALMEEVKFMQNHMSRSSGEIFFLKKKSQKYTKEVKQNLEGSCVGWK